MLRLEDISKMDLKKYDGEIMELIDLSQDTDKEGALVNAVLDSRIPYNAENFLTLGRH